jgi:hypothetical protein
LTVWRGAPGVPSWGWFYPHHYPPMLSDVLAYWSRPMACGGVAPSAYVAPMVLGEPFTPFHQLVAVLPPSSAPLLPAALRTLLLEPVSPLAAYFPADVRTDQAEKRAEWEAVVLLPFIDAVVLSAAMTPLLAAAGTLSADERGRNKLRPGARIYRRAGRPGRPPPARPRMLACECLILTRVCVSLGGAGHRRNPRVRGAAAAAAECAFADRHRGALGKPLGTESMGGRP